MICYINFIFSSLTPAAEKYIDLFKPTTNDDYLRKHYPIHELSHNLTINQTK